MAPDRRSDAASILDTPDTRAAALGYCPGMARRPRSRDDRAIETAEIFSVGSELTTGETADTNAGELAADLTGMGVSVERMTALPDDLDAVRDAFSAALGRVGLVVSTGGLGPTPDDLTREAIAAACGLEPVVDPALEAWLRGLFERRGLEMAERNRKQAWLVAGATAIPNENGTAPGWFLERPGGRVVVALPGPPREMRPMWRDWVVPRLRERGFGRERASRTLRLMGIGESAAAELIGDELLAGDRPSVATYARGDAVDVRVSASGPASATLVEATTRDLEERLRGYVFAHDGEGWPSALAARLDGRRVGVVEIGTGGALVALLGSAPWLVFGELLAPDSGLADAHGDLRRYARRVREMSGVEIGLAVRARERGGDTAVTICVATEWGVTRRTRTAFLGGEDGRRRAALAACAELWQQLAPL